MASTFEHRTAFVDHVRQQANSILENIDDLNELRAAWDAGMNMWLVDASGNDPTDPGYEAGDFDGARGLMTADIAAVVGTTLDAFNALLDAGHRTNLEKIR